MRSTFLVCYDICDDKRLRKVFRTMRDFGDHLQYSIFECQFTPIDLAKCRHVIGEIIKHNEDQVLFVDLGPTEGRGERVITALGIPYTRYGRSLHRGVIDMATVPLNEAMPDYLPARMLNEFVYCPRLFYYEWVEGVFAQNRETIEGSLRHSKLDAGKGDLAPASELPTEEEIHSRSVSLSSETYCLIAKLDLIEAETEL